MENEAISCWTQINKYNTAPVARHRAFHLFSHLFSFFQFWITGAVTLLIVGQEDPNPTAWAESSLALHLFWKDTLKYFFQNCYPSSTYIHHCCSSTVQKFSFPKQGWVSQWEQCCWSWEWNATPTSGPELLINLQLWGLLVWAELLSPQEYFKNTFP